MKAHEKNGGAVRGETAERKMARRETAEREMARARGRGSLLDLEHELTGGLRRRNRKGKRATRESDADVPTRSTETVHARAYDTGAPIRLQYDDRFYRSSPPQPQPPQPQASPPRSTRPRSTQPRPAEPRVEHSEPPAPRRKLPCHGAPASPAPSASAPAAGGVATPSPPALPASPATSPASGPPPSGAKTPDGDGRAAKLPESIAADVAAFQADLAAILGEESEGAEDVTDPNATPPSGPRPGEPRAASESGGPSREPRHAVGPEIFDRLRDDMAYATTYDLGPVALTRRFDELDRALDAEAGPPRRSLPTAASAPRPAELDENELAQDLAALSSEEPKLAPVTAPADVAPTAPVGSSGPGAPTFEAPPAAAIESPALEGARPAAPALAGDLPTAPAGPGVPGLESSIPAEAPAAPAIGTPTPSAPPTAASPPPTPSPAAAQQALAPRAPSTFHPVRHDDVPLVPERPELSSCAACAAMLIAWRAGEKSVDPGRIVRGEGRWSEYYSARSSGDPAAWRLKVEPEREYDPRELNALLRAHGPLVFASSFPGNDCRVVVALDGDGTPDGTGVHVRDPRPRSADGGEAPITESNAGSSYRVTFRALGPQTATSIGKSDRLALHIAHL